MNKEEIRKKLLKFIKKEKYFDDFGDYVIDIDELTEKIGKLFGEVKE